MIKVTSAAFENKAKIPKKHTGEGEDVSPPLSWEGAPEGTKELALICDDPDAPMAEPFVHWVLYKIPPDVSSLPEGGSGGAVEGENNFGTKGYKGPMPPPGHGVHHYHIKLYALDKPVDLGPGAGKNDVLKAIDGHVLDEGELVGTYER